jgi:hypothetical protein
MEWMISVPVLDWFFLLVLFPIGFFWGRRAYRILIRRDFSEVALKKGLPPPHPERFAHYEFIINFVPTVVLLAVLVSSLVIPLMSVFGWVGPEADAYILDRDGRYQYAGVTIWLKLFAGFALSRHAHGFNLGRKKP